MSARLFTEVREKRGLCYAIGARYHSLREAAGIACYAGTSPDKAQETYNVVLREFQRLAEGISEEEMAWAKIGLKSSVILQSESSSSRAGTIGSDYYMLGRVRTLDEIKQKIERPRSIPCSASCGVTRSRISRWSPSDPKRSVRASPVRALCQE
jgi:predicted Zn-dependent peptidase